MNLKVILYSFNVHEFTANMRKSKERKIHRDQLKVSEHEIVMQNNS